MAARFLRSTAALLIAALIAVLTTATAAAEPRNGDSGKGNAPTGAAAPTGTTTASRNSDKTGVECPNGLACQFIPAAYQQNSADPGDYGNYDLANRPADGLAVRFVVIHDTEVSFDGTLAIFQNPLAYVSAHYTLRSSDGFVAQMVETKNVAWQAGNWWVNTHSVGIENEGFAVDPSFYTNQLYGSLARLTRYTAERYGIPLDREHIIGHDQVPGPTAAFQPGMHWDPGPYFDWSKFMALVGAPINSSDADRTGRVVTIDPNFATNQPVVTYCDTNPCRTLPPQPTNFVYLHTAPSDDAPLVNDPGLPGSGTTRANDWGDKAVTGQTFAVADRQGDWIAIWYGGQKAWFEDSEDASTAIPGHGTLVTPKSGLASIRVYGRAYPSSISTATLGYTIPAGQTYVARDIVDADYYDATTFNAPSTYTVFKSNEKFYEISFNHRLAFVKAADVRTVG
jgi:N-acetyl-anhydromuramyl-L-alanine amidase AmpD